jgi:hypothetical protein
MMKLARTLAVLFLVHLIVCMSALYSSAAEESKRKWTSYMRDSTAEYFYDKDALIKGPKGTLQVWRKRVFSTRSAQKEIVTFEQIQCNRRAKYRSLRLTVTYWDGTSKTWDQTSRWADVHPGSPEEYLMDHHCK